jgi:hypothetical protein
VRLTGWSEDSTTTSDAWLQNLNESLINSMLNMITDTKQVKKKKKSGRYTV